MRKKLLITAVAVLVVAATVLMLSATRREGSKGILYRVSNDHATAYLLGSIHIGTAAMHPFGEAIADAMASCDTFVFESDTVSAQSLQTLQNRQTLPQDQTLRSRLGDALTDDVTAAYKALGLSTASLSTRQPWAVINTLAVYSSAAEMGVSNVRKAIDLGVETAVQEYAEKHGKQYAYLETIDEIADTMESFSDALTRYLLQDEIDVILNRKTAASAQTVNQWPTWWRDGDAEAFRDFYRTSLEEADEQLYLEYQDKLITKRNQLMAGRLDALLQKGGTYFVTVGLLHLVPDDDSLLSLLCDMGYIVERIGD